MRHTRMVMALPNSSSSSNSSSSRQESIRLSGERSSINTHHLEANEKPLSSIGGLSDSMRQSIQQFSQFPFQSREMFLYARVLKIHNSIENIRWIIGIPRTNYRYLYIYKD